MLSIYEYTDAASFLKDAWREKKKRNPSFSLRAWAANLGFENNSPLSLMLNRKRPIPIKYLPAFIQSLGLSSREGIYLESLIALTNARTLEQKQFYVERLNRLAPKQRAQMFEIESYKCLGNPLHSVLTEMSVLPDFKPDPRWIQARIRFKASLAEIEDAIERLTGLGILEETRDGKLIKKHKHLTNRPDIADRGSQDYHRNISAMAAEAVTKQTVHEREFNGYALNIKRSDLPKAKKLIRDLVTQFISEVEADPRLAEETYQFNVQFFSLTQPKGEKI